MDDPRYEQAASRITDAQLRVGESAPGLQLLLVLCDVILDPTVAAVATNGADLLVHPDRARSASPRELEASLLAGLLDAVHLHPERPEGCSWEDWNARTAPRVRGILGALGYEDAGVRWTDRLRAPAPRADLARRWGRRRCWARQLLDPHEDPALHRAGLALEGACLSCPHKQHLPYIHPQLGRILDGAPDAPRWVPPLAEMCLGTVWGITSPGLPLVGQVRGLEWLARCGAPVWVQIALRRLPPARAALLRPLLTGSR
jgi:hypothetical protein